jgi:hypothetical protein
MSELNADSDGGTSSRPDYNKTDKSPGGSNLFDDITAMDIDLASEPGASGVNWLDPNAANMQDSGPNSSIFLKPGAEDPSDPGRVDFSQIPLMGSTDDPAEMVPGSAYAGPASSVLKKEIDKTLKELTGGPGSVSFDLPDDGNIAWGVRGATHADQVSQRMSISDDELDLAAPPSGSVVGFGKKKTKKDTDSVFDDAPDFPDGSAIGLGEGLSGVLTEKHSASMSGSILQGMTAERLNPRATADTVNRAKLSTPTPSLSSQEFTLPDDAPRKSSRNTLMTAATLLLGTAAGAAGMYFGLTSQSRSTSTTDGKNNDAGNSAIVAKDDPIEAARLLNAGDPAAALAVYSKLTDDSAETRAGRGQARWMAKLRETAEKGGKLAETDLDVTAARADLKAVIDMADTLESPVEKQALLKSALHYGLMLEATQQPDAAVKHYNAMASRFGKQPNFKRVFESASRRVHFMQRDGGNTIIPADKYSLTNETLLDLGIANLIVIEFDSVQPGIDEAGFFFWDAVNAAANHHYKSAIDNLQRARTAHANVRLKKLGMGLNPISDPTEQMFTRACMELAFYYTFKAQVYDDPVVGAFARENATRTTIEKMITAYKQADTFATELDSQKNKLTQALTDLATAKSDKNAADRAAMTAKENESKLKESLTMLTAKATEDAKALEAAKSAVDAAKSKLAASESALEPVLAKLKEAKLIDAGLNRDEAIAKLTELAKKPNFMMGGGSETDIAKELVAVRNQAKKDKDDAEKKIRDLSDLAKDAPAKMAAAIKDTESKLKKDYDAKLAQATDEARIAKSAAEREKRLADDRIAAIVDETAAKIAAARAGAAITLSDAERDKADQAAKLYGQGLDAMAEANLAMAEQRFSDAIAKNGNDARYWYFLGVAKARQGKDSTADFAKGAELEARGLPAVGLVSSDLNIVQGAIRRQIENARP